MTGSRAWHHRRLRLWGAFTVALILLAYGIAWLVASNQFREAVSTWIAERRADGYRITYSDMKTGGFPARVRVVLSDAAVSAGHPRGSWSWAVDEAVVEANPLRPGQVTARAPGAQRLEARVGARRIAYAGSAEDVTLDVAARSPSAVGAVSVRNLVLEPVDGGDRLAAASLDIAIRNDPATPVDERTATRELSLAAAGLHVPETLALPLGGSVTRIALDAKLLGALGTTPWPEALIRWRDAGGTVEVTRLEVVYGPLDLAADGTLALDAANQPIGAFNARVIGAAATVDALRERGLIGDGDAMAVKALAALTARKPRGGGPPVLEIPLTLQERALYAGPLALAVVPEIHW